MARRSARIVDRRLEKAGDLLQPAALLGEVPARGVARHRLEPAHARRDRSFGNDGDDADVAGAVDMGAAAELDREGAVRARAVERRAHRDDADLVAVLLAEEGAGAGLDRLVDGHELRHDRLVLQEHRVGDVLDLSDLVVGDRLRVAEVEAQAVGRDERALLSHVLAEHLAQGLVQEMRRRVVGADRRAARAVDRELERLRRPRGSRARR